jgi:hypothetical protein
MFVSTINNTARELITGPRIGPIQNGPLITFGPVGERRERRCGKIARRYEVVVRMIEEPARSLKAVGLPS